MPSGGLDECRPEGLSLDDALWAVAVAVAVAAPIGRTPTEKMAGRRTFRFC